MAQQDIAFLHKPSKSLIQADLLMNLPSAEQKADGTIWSKVTSLVAPGSLASQWGMKALGMKDSACVCGSCLDFPFLPYTRH